MAKPKLKIMKTIDDIEELVNSSKAGIIHPELIKVDRDELMDLVQDLRKNTPEEVKGYAEVYAKKDEILSDARDEAAKIRKEALEESQEMREELAQKMNEMLSESEISQRANENAEALINDARVHAERIIADAQKEAEEIYAQAYAYEDQAYSGFQAYLTETLSNLQNIIADCVNETTRNSNHLLGRAGITVFSS